MNKISSSGRGGRPSSKREGGADGSGGYYEAADEEEEEGAEEEEEEEDEEGEEENTQDGLAELAASCPKTFNKLPSFNSVSVKTANKAKKAKTASTINEPSQLVGGVDAGSGDGDGDGGDGDDGDDEPLAQLKMIRGNVYSRVVSSHGKRRELRGDKRH